jgi:sigma-B regulation protein RsbU (phosphoserine phosphatase)
MPNEDRAHGRRFYTDDGIDPEDSRPILERIARLAQRMARTAGAHVILTGRRGAWLTGAGIDTPGPNSRAAALAQLAIQTPQVLWIEDLGEQAWSDAYPLAPEETNHLFYAAAPITLADGRRVGALAILDPLPRPMDSDLA